MHWFSHASLQGTNDLRIEAMTHRRRYLPSGLIHSNPPDWQLPPIASCENTTACLLTADGRKTVGGMIGPDTLMRILILRRHQITDTYEKLTLRHLCGAV